MGATDFHVTAFGKDVHEAYRSAVDDALYEHGHDPYNGTISTTSGVHLFKKGDHPRYGTKAFSKWVEKMIDGEGRKYGVEKWECAGAVEIPRAHVLKKRPDLKGKRFHKFYFFGWAAE